MERLKQIIGTTPWLNGLNVFISAIEDNLQENPNIALDASKTLLESLAKTILSDRGKEYNANSEFKHLLRDAVKTSSAMEQIKDTNSLQRIIQGFDTIANAIGTLRNKYGTFSHGQDIQAEQIDFLSVNFVVDATALVARFLIDLHSHEKLTKKRLRYDEHTDFNAYLDSEDDENGLEVLGIHITPSKALFNEDTEAYREKLIEFKDEKARAMGMLANEFSESVFDELYSLKDGLNTAELNEILECLEKNGKNLERLSEDVLIQIKSIFPDDYVKKKTFFANICSTEIGEIMSSI